MGNRVFIGTSSFNYKHWSSIFYPEELSQKKWYSFYSQQFNYVEINSTFYGIPRKEVFENRAVSTEENFHILWKVNRLITHTKKLKAPSDTMVSIPENIAGPGNKMGPLLFQFPPSFMNNNDAIGYAVENDWQFREIIIKIMPCRN